MARRWPRSRWCATGEVGEGDVEGEVECEAECGDGSGTPLLTAGLWASSSSAKPRSRSKRSILGGLSRLLRAEEKNPQC